MDSREEAVRAARFNEKTAADGHAGAAESKAPGDTGAVSSEDPLGIYITPSAPTLGRLLPCTPHKPYPSPHCLRGSGPRATLPHSSTPEGIVQHQTYKIYHGG